VGWKAAGKTDQRGRPARRPVGHPDSPPDVRAAWSDVVNSTLERVAL